MNIQMYIYDFKNLYVQELSSFTKCFTYNDINIDKLINYPHVLPKKKHRTE